MLLHGTPSSSAAAAAALVASARSAALKNVNTLGKCRAQRDLQLLASRWTPQASFSRSASTLISHKGVLCRCSASRKTPERQLSTYAVGRSSTSRLWTTPTALKAAGAGDVIHPSSSKQRYCSIARLSTRSFTSSSVRSLQAASGSSSITIDQSRNHQSSWSNNNNNDSNSREVQKNKKKPRRRFWLLSIAGAITLAGVIGWNVDPSVRRFFIALKRCAIVAVAVAECIVDYKLLFRKEWDDPLVRHNDYKACHSKSRFLSRERGENWFLIVISFRITERCAERILKCLQRNGGIYIKLGQHLSAVQLVPEEWSSTMRPLQVRPFTQSGKISAIDLQVLIPTPVNSLGSMSTHSVSPSFTIT